MIQTAAEIGLELKRYLDGTPPRSQDQRIVSAYVDRLASTAGLFAEDALAFVAVADQLVRYAARASEEDLSDDGRREVLETAALLTARGAEVLELMTGYARDSFVAGLHRTH